MKTHEESCDEGLTIIVVQQSTGGRILGQSLPIHDVGIANNLQVIVGIDKSHVLITGEDAPLREK